MAGSRQSSGGKGGTTGRRAAEKRKQIRTAAYQCFRDGGFHETTVDSICARAKISKGSFYWHYPSKQDVFVDILDLDARGHGPAL